MITELIFFLWNEFFKEQLSCSGMMVLQSDDMNSEQSIVLNNQMQMIRNCFVYLRVFVCCLEFNIPSQILCFLKVLDLELGEMLSCARTLLVCYE